MKIYITVILLIMANFQWGFILSNFDRIETLKSISNTILDVKAQNKYISSIENNGFISINKLLSEPSIFPDIPDIIEIPNIEVTAPIFTSSGVSFDELLDKGVISMDINNRKGKYIFGHSSAENKSDFQYIFTKITKLGTGDSVFIENMDGSIEEYKYTDSFYKDPNKLEELEDSQEKLYLITCYPFGTNWKRYVVEFKKEKKYKKEL